MKTDNEKLELLSESLNSELDVNLVIHNTTKMKIYFDKEIEANKYTDLPDENTKAVIEVDSDLVIDDLNSMSIVYARDNEDDEEGYILNFQKEINQKMMDIRQIVKQTIGLDTENGIYVSDVSSLYDGKPTTRYTLEYAI